MRFRSIALALTLSACGEVSSNVPVDESVRLDPEALGFGRVEVGHRAERTVAIRNGTDEAIELEGAPPFLVSTTLAPGETASIPIAFEPTQPGAAALDLPVGDALLRLEGTGLGLSDPTCIELEPIDFGAAPIGCDAARATTLVRNRCDGPVAIERFGTTDPAFAVARHRVLPLVLAAGASSEIEVIFRPDSVVEKRASLVAINDAGAASPGDLRGDGFAAAVAERFEPIPIPMQDLVVVVDPFALEAELDRIGALASRLAVQLSSQQLDFRVAVTSAADGCGLVAGEAIGGILTLQSADFPGALARRMQLAICPDAESPRYLDAAGRVLRILARPGANHTVLLIGHRDDAGDLPVSSELVEMAEAVGGRREILSIHAIVPLEGRCAEASAGRLVAAAEATDGHLVAICEEGWEPNVIWERTDEFRSHWLLSGTPLDADGNGGIDAADGLRVYVNGIEKPPAHSNGTPAWKYNRELNSIDFWPLDVPRPGQPMEVQYLAPSCE